MEYGCILLLFLNFMYLKYWKVPYHNHSKIITVVKWLLFHSLLCLALFGGTEFIPHGRVLSVILAQAKCVSFVKTKWIYFTGFHEIKFWAISKMPSFLQESLYLWCIVMAYLSAQMFSAWRIKWPQRLMLLWQRPCRWLAGGTEGIYYSPWSPPLTFKVSKAVVAPW